MILFFHYFVKVIPKRLQKSILEKVLLFRYKFDIIDSKINIYFLTVSAGGGKGFFRCDATHERMIL